MAGEGREMVAHEIEREVHRMSGGVGVTVVEAEDAVVVRGQIAALKGVVAPLTSSVHG